MRSNEISDFGFRISEIEVLNAKREVTEISDLGF